MEDPPQILAPRKDLGEVRRLLERYPVPLVNDKPFVFAYGTAGFRYDASLLESVMVRVGLTAVLRSLVLGNQPVGVMITASHNDESYNGVKLADPHGGMMASEGERLAVQLANALTVEEVFSIMNSILNSSFDKAVVHVGRDTRSHSPALCQLVQRAVRALGGTVVLHGVVTTPQLHHAVRHSNPQYLPLLIPPRPNLQGYFNLMAHAYYNLLLTQSKGSFNNHTLEPLVVDCACGVGFAHVERLHETLQGLDPTVCRPLVARNAPGEGPLNEDCGSEHVQKQVQPPKWYNEETTSSSRIPYACSLDGDADRIVFFRSSTQKRPSFSLLDGDKMAVLICTFVQQELAALEAALAHHSQATLQPPLELGVVQTAYANGASTQFLKDRVFSSDAQVLIAKTGVKHVHHKAETLDIGVYFEANGHGTVLFGRKFDEAMAHAKRVLGDQDCVALRRLCCLPSLVNQAVGDALSDMLLMDAILQLQGWNLETWDGLYKDLPSRQCKVKVQDRSVIQTNENETRCTEPIKLQQALDEAMSRSRGGRCFVRPSGTENVVRVYAEAASMQEADALATKAARLVHDLCGGVGEPPCFPSSKM